MTRQLNDPVRVILDIDPNKKRDRVRPLFVYLEDTRYVVKTFGFSHPRFYGERKVLVMDLNVGHLDMRIEMDQRTLECILTWVSDGDIS